MLVHGYETIDRRILRHVVEHNLDDLLAFVHSVRSRFLN
nr:HepT-like ribonuclease domain-containing protein [Thiohalomonas denitrificans]